MFDNTISYVKKKFHLLKKDSLAKQAFYLLIMGFLILFAASKIEPDFGITHVFGIVTVIIGIVLCSDIILAKKFNMHISMEQLNFSIHLLTFIVLIPQLITSNYTNFSHVIILIIILFSSRGILFSIFYWLALKSKNNSKKNKKLNASAYSFLVILVILLIYSSYDFLAYKLFILFLVYCIYNLVREKYLVRYMESASKGNVIIKKTIFSEVWNISASSLLILLIMFLLFNYNVLTISDSRSTLYYFYSTTAQVFAAILGIVVMFSILILQTNEKKHDERKKFLKDGVKGFAIIYMLIIILSIIGILAKTTIDFNSIVNIPDSPDVNTVQNIFSMTIFELTLLMSPAALLYLFAMISDFLKWDATFEIPPGQTILSDTIIKNSKGADRVKVEVKPPQN